MRKSFQRVIATLNLFQGKQSLIIFLLAAIFALTACDDSSSASGDDNNVILSGDSREESSDSRSNDKDEAISSSGKVTDKDSEPAEVSSSSVESSDSKSSSSVKSGDSSSSSSAGKVESSSSIGDVSKSYAETKVMPSGTFDCSKYNCFTTENLNQVFLEAGKYGEILDERDGQVYKTIQIGTQTWMAENLNYDPGQGGSGSSAYDWSWCYDDDPSNCAKYGRLYTWAAAMDSATTYCGFGKSCTATHPVQGICPSGWHLPDTTDWHDLIVAAGGQYSAGAKLRSTSGWENDRWGNDGNGTDAFGFSALPSGYRSRGGDYHTAGGYAYIWSSFEYITGLVAYEMGLRCNVADAYIERGNEESGYAVRCLKDSD
ncbi:MAG: fibrobacter succinogenes major paralogous domain-containing protein [Fibrobacter sp.]|nr:fibrobacter succinogenes major paralogous domain-containing protein [Fibrobacter sp.]